MQGHTCFCLWHFGQHSPTRETVEQNHWTNVAFIHFRGQNYCLKPFWSTQMLRVLCSTVIPLQVDFAAPGTPSQGCLSQWCWLYPGELDELTLVNGPDLLMAPSHPPKCHIPPETLRARSHGSLMAQWTFIWDGNFPARFKRYKEVIIHGFLCVTKLFRRDCSAIHGRSALLHLPSKIELLPSDIVSLRISH